MSPRAKSQSDYGHAIDPRGECYNTLFSMVLATLAADLPVFLHGHPGVGKSTLAVELAESLGLPLVDIRLAQRDPAELGGIYFPDKEHKVLEHLAPNWVQPVMEGPTLLFLDELNAAVTRLHQSISYQIVLERRVGPFRFHPGTIIMAAGNLEEDAAVVTPLSSALANRFVHFTLRVDAESWLNWARREELEPRLVSYFETKGHLADQLLYDHTGEDAFPSPRSWAMASKVLEYAPEGHERRLVAACVGAPAAEKFFQYLKLYHRLSPARIVTRGGEVDFTKKRNQDPSFVHATVNAVANWVAEQDHFDPRWAPNLVKFMGSRGLDPEFVFIFLRELRERTGAMEYLRHVPEFRALAGNLVQLNVGVYQ